MYDIREMQEKGLEQWKDGCMIFAKCKKRPDRWKDECKIFAECEKPWSMERWMIFAKCKRPWSINDDCKKFAKCKIMLWLMNDGWKNLRNEK